VSDSGGAITVQRPNGDEHYYLSNDYTHSTSFDIDHELVKDGGYLRVQFGYDDWYEGDGTAYYSWSVEPLVMVVDSACY
nr:hypothetical protein [Planctomycetota bacterium]